MSWVDNMNVKTISSEELRKQVTALDFKVVYVPHERIKYHNACYNVMVEGKKIFPPAAQSLRIPLNEIWISEHWEKYERFILYHELREIEYRRQGATAEDAHFLSQKDCILMWKDDPVWRKGLVELHIQDVLTRIEDIGSQKKIR